VKVGFLSNQLDNRGTGNAMYDYARWNQALLRNESYIFTFIGGSHSSPMVQKYNDRFTQVKFIQPEEVAFQTRGMDVLYHIKYGEPDGIRTNSDVIYAVHSVFTNTPHGDRYATISKWLSSIGPIGGITPYVPHIIDLPNHQLDYRKQLGISDDATVFGRYGGLDTFDISWVWDVIEKVVYENPNVFFLFANTQSWIKHPRVIHMEELVTASQKTTFINTCDYMLHARHRGETFGISVGEFASKGKPIITYTESGERAHIFELSTDEFGRPNYLGYADQFDLYRILIEKSSQFSKDYYKPIYGYQKHKPEQVMEKFREVFLEAI
jgi:hypothetical protein